MVAMGVVQDHGNRVCMLMVVSMAVKVVMAIRIYSFVHSIMQMEMKYE